MYKESVFYVMHAFTGRRISSSMSVLLIQPLIQNHTIVLACVLVNH